MTFRLFFEDFEYDHVSDLEIFAELPNAKIEDLNNNWNIGGDTLNHAHQIAALVKLIESGIRVPPIQMELSDYDRNVNFVNDGNHRIRAFIISKRMGFMRILEGL